MRKLLNTLYVTTPEAYLSRDGENVVVRIEQQERFRIPVHNIEGIVCFGYMGASPALMGFCAEKGVAVSFLNEYGKFLARVTGPVTGNVLLRRKQYRVADNEEEASKLAIGFITGKIANCKTVLQRALRDHASSINVKEITHVVDTLTNQVLRLQKCADLDEVRGVEGEAARTYFSVFNEMILCQKESFYIYQRNRRPPLDNMNALLSFLYTLLVHDVESALETVGLDPFVGFLHRDRPGRPGLALDLMEELRPYLADRLALSLVNRRQITADGFCIKESGGIVMDADTRKVVLTAWQKRKQEEITHPFLNEKIPIGLIPYAQAMLLARFLRGDLDGYPPFFWR
ncbi:MAG: CRISP-associated protein Cas1 [Petroclostridium sp.]|jgi:CRISPR-associated protein Cas1|nr:CRISPR-associated protein Cas1 [Clostridia bacterium]MDK2809547.1 CRISP-associated protein Cas1 [Petroclostridium sp.]